MLTYLEVISFCQTSLIFYLYILLCVVSWQVLVKTLARHMLCTPSMSTVQAQKEQNLGQFSDATVILMIYTCTSKKR